MGQPNGVDTAVSYLGHGEVQRSTGGAHALLAVHRGEWRGWGVAWCSWRGLGWFYRQGPAYRGRSARTASKAFRRDISSQIRRGGAGYVETRCLPGSGGVLEGVGRAARVEAQRAGPILPATPRVPRRGIGEKGGVMARGGARVLSRARSGSRGTGRVRRGGLGASLTALRSTATQRHVGARERGRG